MFIANIVINFNFPKTNIGILVIYNRNLNHINVGVWFVKCNLKISVENIAVCIFKFSCIVNRMILGIKNSIFILVIESNIELISVFRYSIVYCAVRKRTSAVQNNKHLRNSSAFVIIESVVNPILTCITAGRSSSIVTISYQIKIKKVTCASVLFKSCISCYVFRSCRKNIESNKNN